MSEAAKPNRLQVPLPGGSARVPTGAMQFQGDWPGLFVRGDEAVMIAWSIRELQACLAGSGEMRVASALGRLSPLADIIERDVRVRPDEST